MVYGLNGEGGCHQGCIGWFEGGEKDWGTRAGCEGDVGSVIGGVGERVS